MIDSKLRGFWPISKSNCFFSSSGCLKRSTLVERSLDSQMKSRQTWMTRWRNSRVGMNEFSFIGKMSAKKRIDQYTAEKNSDWCNCANGKWPIAVVHNSQFSWWLLHRPIFQRLLIKMNELSVDNVPTRTLLLSESLRSYFVNSELASTVFPHRGSNTADWRCQGNCLDRWVVKVHWLETRKGLERSP